MLQRALALHRQGQLAQARQLYEQLLAHDPRHFDALKLLGTIALQSGDMHAAVRLITQAIEVHAGDPGAYANRAVAFQSLGQFDAALRDCEAALRLDAANIDA